MGSRPPPAKRDPRDARVRSGRLGPRIGASIGVTALCLVTLASCSDAGSTKTTIRVFAASSLMSAFNDIAHRFEVNHPEVEVSVTYGESDKLAEKIASGVQADVFASAVERQMRLVASSGDTSEEPVAFATNRLAIVTPKDNPAHIRTIRDLANPKVGVVLASRGVTVGHYARAALAKAGIVHHVHVVSNVKDAKGVVSEARAGDSEAGICFVTDVTPASSGNVFEVAIPDRYNYPATYEIAPVSTSDLAARFSGFVRSSGGEGILASYGFGAAPT